MEGLRLLYQKYINTSDKKDFPSSAIKCFDKCVKENDFEDKLVDFVRALESIMVTEKQEIASTLALRSAFLLGETRPKCKEIFKDIKKAYSIRSKIVHGKLEEVDALKCAEYAKKTERYVRKALNLWLDETKKGYTAKEIYNFIEDKIFEA